MKQKLRKDFARNVKENSLKIKRIIPCKYVFLHLKKKVPRVSEREGTQLNYIQCSRFVEPHLERK